MIRIGIVVCSWFEQKNIPKYLNLVLTNLKNQRHPFHLDVLVSDNTSSPRFINQLTTWCKRNSSTHTTFSCISENVHRPMFDSLNLGLFTLKNSGEYDFLAYNADDIWFAKPDGLEKVMKEFEQPNIGLVSPHVGGDTTLPYFSHLIDEAGETTEVKIGEHVNNHFSMFSKYFMEKFDYRYVDIFGAWGSVSLISFQCASVGKKWLLHRGGKMINGRTIPKLKRKRRGINGVFLRKKGAKEEKKGFLRHPTPPAEVSKSLEKVFGPGYEVGLGYSVWNAKAGIPTDQLYGQFWMDYDKSLYTESGEIKDPEPLYRYLVENMFMPNMDYQSRFDAATKRLVI